MISIHKLRGIKHLVTHANCPDGIASALIVKNALPDVRVAFVKHGTKEHLEMPADEGMLFCDFAPPEGRASDFIEAGAIVLDHHPTQKEMIDEFVEVHLGVFGENDRNECGAWLAYEHVWLPLKVDYEEEAFNILKARLVRRGPRDPNEQRTPSHIDHVQEFAELAGVRDTWKKDDPRWQAACEQAEELMFWGFENLDFDSITHPAAVSLGSILFQKKLEHARSAIGESHRFATEKGTRVLVFQGVTPTSDAAEIVEKREQKFEAERRGDDILWMRTDIVAGFHYRVDAGKLQLTFSTRSHTGYDVGAFCKSKGGGGHRAAAGFTVEQSAEVGANPYAVFRLILEEWEKGQ